MLSGIICIPYAKIGYPFFRTAGNKPQMDNGTSHILPERTLNFLFYRTCHCDASLISDAIVVLGLLFYCQWCFAIHTMHVETGWEKSSYFVWMLFERMLSHSLMKQTMGDSRLKFPHRHITTECGIRAYFCGRQQSLNQHCKETACVCVCEKYNASKESQSVSKL